MAMQPAQKITSGELGASVAVTSVGGVVIANPAARCRGGAEDQSSAMLPRESPFVLWSSHDTATKAARSWLWATRQHSTPTYAGTRLRTRSSVTPANVSIETSTKSKIQTYRQWRRR